MINWLIVQRICAYAVGAISLAILAWWIVVGVSPIRQQRWLEKRAKRAGNQKSRMVVSLLGWVFAIIVLLVRDFIFNENPAVFNSKVYGNTIMNVGIFGLIMIVFVSRQPKFTTADIIAPEPISKRMIVLATVIFSSCAAIFFIVGYIGPRAFHERYSWVESGLSNGMLLVIPVVIVWSFIKWARGDYDELKG
jgi:magnesium-transporting ATPase (P-type)